LGEAADGESPVKEEGRCSKMRKHYSAVIAVVVCVAIVAGAIGFALAQRRGIGGAGGAPLGGPEGPLMGAQRGMMAAIAVAGPAVYVASGGTLYKFDAETLRLIASVNIAPQQ